MTVNLPRIDRIDVRIVRVPRTEHNRVTHAYGTTPDAHYALVEVHADGLVGLGEAPTEIWWTGEDAASVRWAIETHLAPALVGQSWGIRDAARRMDRAMYGSPYAKSAIQMALWDLLGRQTGLPMYALLGGSRPEPVPVKYGIGWGDVDRVRDEIAHGRSLGFGFFKLKVGQELTSDLERVAAAVGALREGESIGVDANAGWTVPVALRALAPLQEMGVAFLEQPVSATVPRAMAEIAHRSAIPVMIHEGLMSLAQAPEIAALRAAHLWSLTPSTHGGVVQTCDMLAIAAAHDVPCLFGSTFELGVATAHMLHLGAAFPTIRTCPVPSDLPGPLYVARDIIAEPIVVADGFAHVPDGPGLGVELDEAFVAECVARAEG